MSAVVDGDGTVSGERLPWPPTRVPQLTQPLGDDDKSPGGQTRQPRFDEVLHSDSSHGIDAGGCSAGGYKGGERVSSGHIKGLATHTLGPIC